MSDNPAKTAVILANLGTPTAPTAKAVGRFLREFLADRRVVEVPRLLWWLILNGIIVPFRSPKVAKAYASIWWEEGSPLAVITRRQVAALQARLQQEWGEHAPTVTYAMTYGDPKLADTIAKLHKEGIERLLLLPLYPQFSATTTASLYDQVAALWQRQRDLSDVRIVHHYYDHPGYAEALADSIERYLADHPLPDRLLLSFHGVPRAYVDKGDPYYDHCQDTLAKLSAVVQKRLNIPPETLALSFQSRLGRAEWLRPYTDEVLQDWPKQGVRSVAVLCPAFAADCLETLEEIAEENRETFLEAGGERFDYIPCLNDDPGHIDLLAAIVARELSLPAQ